MVSVVHGRLEGTSELEGLEIYLLSKDVRLYVGVLKDHGGGDLWDIQVEKRVEVSDFDVAKDSANAHATGDRARVSKLRYRGCPSQRVNSCPLDALGPHRKMRMTLTQPLAVMVTVSWIRFMSSTRDRGTAWCRSLGRY